MVNKNNKGFTLVELLAVIAVLGLILIIAVPKVMDVLNTQKKRTLELTTRSIIKAAEEKYLENTSYGIDEEITCESVSNITNSDFESCKILFDNNGNASVILNGKGRYDGLNVCLGSKENISVVKEECPLVCSNYERIFAKVNPVKPYEVNKVESCITTVTEIITSIGMIDTIGPAISPLCNGQTVEGTTFNDAVNMIVSNNFTSEKELIEKEVIKGTIENECVSKYASKYVENLYNNTTTRISNGLTKDNTRDANIRYSGGNDTVKNYVEFGNAGELWRIIGIFEVKTSSGKTQKLLKLTREESIGNFGVDSSADDVNNGDGINQWGESTYENGSPYEGADLMRMLNGYYIGNSSSCTYCDSDDQETCSNDCSSTVTPISSKHKNMIENVVWNTGAINIGDTNIFNMDQMFFNTVNAYNAERGTVGGKEHCEDCTDTVNRTTTWKGLVALPYETDFVYASSEDNCKTNGFTGCDSNLTNCSCKNNNWMYNSTGYLDVKYFFTWFSNNNISYVGYMGVPFFAYVYPNNGIGTQFVHPAIYLKLNVGIVEGDGSSTNPYKLSL